MHTVADGDPSCGTPLCSQNLAVAVVEAAPLDTSTFAAMLTPQPNTFVNTVAGRLQPPNELAQAQ